MRVFRSLTCVAFGVAILSGGAGAVPVDGKVEPAYGGSLSTQTTQTSRGDADEYFASELDEAFGFVTGDTLYLLLAGNYNRFSSELLPAVNQLQLYIDTGPGGQNTLSSSNPNLGLSVKLPTMTGLQFDDGFAPDYWFASARESATGLYCHFAELPAGGGGAGQFLGSSTAGSMGTLAGGVNPLGILASVDNSNTAGVTAGCDASSGAGVTTGIEWAIPLAAIGNPSGAIRVCALLASIGTEGQVSNQVLGPVPPGTCAPGSASGVNFANIPGAQYFTIDVVTSAARTTWGRLKSMYR